MLTAFVPVIVAAIMFFAFTNASMVAAGSLGYNSLTEILYLIAAAIAVIDFFRRRPFPGSLAFVAFVLTAYMVSLAATALVAKNPGLTIEETISSAKRAVFVVLMTAIITDRVRFRWAVYGVVTGATFLGFLTVIQSVFSVQYMDFYGFGRVTQAEIADHIDSWRYIGPVDDPNYYAQLLLLALPLIAIAAVSFGKSVSGFVFALAAAIVFSAMLMTLSRGTLLAGLVVLGVAFWGQRKKFFLGAILVIAAAAVAIQFAPSTVVQRFVGVIDDLSSAMSGNGFIADKAIAGRLAEMEAAIRLFFEHPVFGAGYANFDALYQDIARLNSLMSRGAGRETHNLYLEILAERGVVGLAVFAGLIALVISSAGQGARAMAASGHRLEADFSRAAVLSITGYLATSFFLHEAFTTSFWAIVTLAFAAIQVASLPEPVRTTPLPETHHFRAGEIDIARPAGQNVRT